MLTICRSAHDVKRKSNRSDESPPQASSSRTNAPDMTEHSSLCLFKLSLPSSASVWRGLSLLLQASGLHCQVADYCTPPPCVKAAGWRIKSKLTAAILLFLLLLTPPASVSSTQQNPEALWIGEEASIPSRNNQCALGETSMPMRSGATAETRMDGDFDSEFTEHLSPGGTSCSPGVRAPNSV